MPLVKVLTLNTWGDRLEMHSRAADIAEGILQLEPSIVCMQEVLSPAVKDTLRATLSGQYIMVSSELHHPSPYPLLAYLPSGVFAVFAAACAAVSGAGAREWLTWPACVCAVLLGTALSPHGVFLLIRVLVLRTMSPDMMGLTVLVKRRCRDTAEAGWLSADKITAHPFAHDLRAYPQPGLRQWPVYWVSHCFIRPGFMLVRCTGGLRECEDIWVATAHLVISARGTSENPRRIEQVTKLNDALVSLVEVHQATAYGSTDKLLPSDVNLQVEPETSASPSAASLPSSPMLVVGGDFNAPDNSPEIDYMCKAGFLDCASSAPFLTWDQALNPYTQFDLAEPNARMDYVFMSGQRTDDPRQAVDTTLVSTARAFDGDTAPIVSDHFGVLATIRVESAV